MAGRVEAAKLPVWPSDRVGAPVGILAVALAKASTREGCTYVLSAYALAADQ
jgi:hypothetical protein